MGDDDISGLSDHAQVATLQVKLNHLAGAWLKMNALESAKGANGRARNIRKLQIELHDFVARDLPRIRHRHEDIERIRGGDLRVRQGEIAVLECCVAQTVSERPERLAFEIAIRAAFHRVVLEVGQLVNILIERHGQTSRGIVLAAQRLGNSGSAFLAGVPSFDDGVGVLLLPVRGQSAAVHEHHNQGLAGRGHRLHQGLFRFGHLQVGAVSAEEAGLVDRHLFPFQTACDANDRDNDISIFRG